MPPKMYSFCLHKYQYMLAWTYFEKQKAVKATGKKKKTPTMQAHMFYQELWIFNIFSHIFLLVCILIYAPFFHE